MYEAEAEAGGVRTQRSENDTFPLPGRAASEDGIELFLHHDHI